MQAARASKRILVQSATGSGKSVIFAELIRRATEKGKQTLFLVHRRELIYQADRHLKRHGIQTGIIMNGEQYAPGCQVQLGSVPTVYRRLKKIDMSRFAFVVLDECHHASSMTNKKIIEGVNGAHVLGFTATPIRKAGAPLGDIFDMMVRGPKVQDLIDQGHLCDVEYMVPNPVDLRGVASVGGDYSEKGLQEKVVPKLIGGVVDHYLKYGGKKGIIFTCGKKHSNYLRDEFAKNARTALVIDSDTKDDERAEMEKEFRDGETGILLNVGIFTEGYDVPDCDTMVLARPTKSLGLYLQMCLDSETEILTSHGWKGMGKIRVGDCAAAC
ncbi:MAG: DEAD/DEAH box helicase, partial [Nitrospira sp.]|nr:DEAD/DEAH box helicase [Nitrospira sp.]